MTVMSKIMIWWVFLFRMRLDVNEFILKRLILCLNLFSYLREWFILYVWIKQPLLSFEDNRKYFICEVLYKNDVHFNLQTFSKINTDNSTRKKQTNLSPIRRPQNFQTHTEKGNEHEKTTRLTKQNQLPLIHPPSHTT